MNVFNFSTADFDEKQPQKMTLKSVRLKIFSIILYASITIVTLFSTYDYIKERRMLMYALTEDIQLSMERLTNMLQEPLLSENKSYVQKIIETEMMNKQIYAIVIRGPDSKTVFCAAERNDAWDIVRSEGNIPGDFIIKKGQIISKKKAVGTVETCFTTRFIEERMKKEISFTAIKVLIMSLCLASVSLLVVNLFTKPMFQAAQEKNQLFSQSDGQAISTDDLDEYTVAELKKVTETIIALIKKDHLSRF